MSRARLRISATLAASMIVGWFLRVLVEQLPAWAALAVMAAAFALSVLTEIAERASQERPR